MMVIPYSQAQLAAMLTLVKAIYQECKSTLISVHHNAVHHHLMLLPLCVRNAISLLRPACKYIKTLQCMNISCRCTVPCRCLALLQSKVQAVRVRSQGMQLPCVQLMTAPLVRTAPQLVHVKLSTAVAHANTNFFHVLCRVSCGVRLLLHCWCKISAWRFALATLQHILAWARSSFVKYVAVSSAKHFLCVC